MEEQIDSNVAEAAPEAPATETNVGDANEGSAPASDSLMGSTPDQQDASLVGSAPDFETKQNEEYAYDSNLLNEDGSFNKEYAIEKANEAKESNEKYEDRIATLRGKLSNNKAPEEQEAYFQDFAPEEKYMQ